VLPFSGVLAGTSRNNEVGAWCAAEVVAQSGVLFFLISRIIIYLGYYINEKNTKFL